MKIVHEEYIKGRELYLPALSYMMWYTYGQYQYGKMLFHFSGLTIIHIFRRQFRNCLIINNKLKTLSGSSFFLAPPVGFEPTTCRLTVGRSTVELQGNGNKRCYYSMS